MKQPRVPEYRGRTGNTGIEAFIKTLILFLKDFCHETWQESLSRNRMTQEMLKQVYPIGSVYLTEKEENPKSLFGGTWTAIESPLTVNMWKRTG